MPGHNWTMKKLCRWVAEKLGKPVSRSTLRTILKRTNLSWKKCKKYLAKADSEKRAQFVEQFQLLYERMLRGEVRIIYIDEAHIHQDMDLGYTWSLKGEPAWRSSTSPGRGKRINWYGAYDFTEGRTFIWEDGMCDGENTIHFLQRLSTWLDESERQVVIIWDGASYHRSKTVQAAAQDLGFQLLPLPSYSPELNPEERLNADLKHAIGSKVPVRTKAKLRAAATEHMTMLENTPERVKKYFGDKHVAYAAS